MAVACVDTDLNKTIQLTDAAMSVTMDITGCNLILLGLDYRYGTILSVKQGANNLTQWGLEFGNISDNQATRIYYIVSPAAGVITVTFTNSNNTGVMYVASFSGANVADPVYAFTPIKDSGGPDTLSDSLSGVANGDFAFSFVGANYGQTPAPSLAASAGQSNLRVGNSGLSEDGSQGWGSTKPITGSSVSVGYAWDSATLPFGAINWGHALVGIKQGGGGGGGFPSGLRGNGGALDGALAAPVRWKRRKSSIYVPATFRQAA